MASDKDNVVILHMFQRGRQSPNPSPYPLKLETFLRMADIKYEADFSKPRSSKGKSPWITLNGVDVADSQLAIEYITNHFGESANLSSHLSPREKAEARAMRAILEDNLYFVVVMNRWVFGDKDYLINEVMPPLPGPGFLHKFIIGQVGKAMKKQAEGQGIGRHSKEEITRIGEEDIRAISTFLGDKPFMMGEKPSNIDCVVFGFMTQTIYATPHDSPFHKLVMEECTNLKAHHDRIREKYWPDWEDCKWKPKE